MLKYIYVELKCMLKYIYVEWKCMLKYCVCMLNSKYFKNVHFEIEFCSKHCMLKSSMSKYLYVQFQYVEITVC